MRLFCNDHEIRVRNSMPIVLFRICTLALLKDLKLDDGKLIFIILANIIWRPVK